MKWTKALSAAVVLLGCTAGGLGTQARVLATDDQKRNETLALRVYGSKPVQDEIARTEAYYRKAKVASLLDGSKAIEGAAKALGMASVDYALAEDPGMAGVMWVFNAPHQWFGLNVPRSGFGVDNPDNIYRHVALAPGAHYEISGSIKSPGPAQETFMLYNAVPGTGAGEMKADAGAIGGVLSSEQIRTAPDGRFTITIDGDPANGRPNHLQVKSDKGFLTIRDTLADWNAQNVTALQVRRTDGPSAPPPREEAVAKRAVELLSQMTPFWVTYFDKFTYDAQKPNDIQKAWAREGGWGFASGGWFQLAADEALIVTLDPLGAKYLGFQLTDQWGVSRDYVSHTESLNATQAKPNADGTITYVIAPHDPGVYNWLDPVGLRSGLYAIRWQAVPKGTEADKAVRDARVVKLNALKDAMPPGTVFVTPAERKAQLEARVKSYERRLVE